MSYQLIHEDIEVEELVSKFPDTIPLLTQKGIICIQCGAPIWGTIGEAIERNGLNVDDVISQLNKAVKQSHS